MLLLQSSVNTEVSFDFTKMTLPVATLIVIGALAALSMILFFLAKYVRKAGFLEIGKNDDQSHKEEDKLSAKNDDNMKKIEELLVSDAAERKRRQEQLDETLRDLRETAQMAASQSCIGIMYSPIAPVMEIFTAAISHFKQHGNGNGRERVLQVIMQGEHNRSLWRTALSEDMKKNGPCEDRYFLDTIKFIEEQCSKRHKELN